jgi:hypothetical protein
VNKGFHPFEVLFNLAGLGVHADGSNKEIFHEPTRQLAVELTRGAFVGKGDLFWSTGVLE